MKWSLIFLFLSAQVETVRTFFIQAEVQMLLQYSSTSQKVSEMPKSKKAALWSCFCANITQINLIILHFFVTSIMWNTSRENKDQKQLCLSLPTLEMGDFPHLNRKINKCLPVSSLRHLHQSWVKNASTLVFYSFSVVAPSVWGREGTQWGETVTTED